MSLLPELGQDFLANMNLIKEVRPGWLGRKGYVICYINEKFQTEFLDKIAPIRKRKKWERFITASGFAAYINLLQIDNYLFPTSFLHDLKLKDQNLPVFAVRVFGRRRPGVLPLMLLPNLKAKWGWYRGDVFAKIMKEFGEKYINSIKDLFPTDLWEKIHEGLQLKEFEI
jgi:hypothetical protein